MNDCLPIVCGENQCHDLLQALHRVSDSLVTTGNDHGLNAWVTWSDLIIHLESAAQPSTVSISNMNAIKEKQMRAIDDLKERKKANLLNQMQKKWGGSTKEEYLEFLERVLPDYARENNNASSTVLSQGGGGAVSSNQTARGADREGAERRHGNLQSENSDQIIVKECKEDKKVSTNDKGSEYFRRIQEQLSKLDLSSTQRSSRLGVSGRIEDQMARTAEERRQAEREIARLEAECSLDDSEGRREERQEGLVAMRKQPLSEKEEAAVEHSLAGPHDHSVLVDKFNQDITRLKMSCLLPGTWLNDEVVNFYMNMLQERDKALCALPGSSRKPSHFFNSFFVSKLLERDEYTYRNVKRWTKKFDIFSKEKVFFPVNISNTHWTMMVAYIDKKRVVYYDSMGGSGNKYTKAIVRYLNDDSVDKRKCPIDVSEWATEAAGRGGTPQQDNGFDCGMFTVMYADFLSDDLPLAFDQSDISEFRRKAVAAILRGELSYTLS